MMSSLFEKSHVYATYEFGRYSVKLWEQLRPDYALRVGVIVGYVVTNAATGELVQVKVTGKYDPRNDTWPQDERLRNAYAINNRYFSRAVRVANSVLDVMEREYWTVD